MSTKVAVLCYTQLGSESQSITQLSLVGPGLQESALKLWMNAMQEMVEEPRFIVQNTYLETNLIEG